MSEDRPTQRMPIHEFAVRVLNEALQAEPLIITELVDRRILCGTAFDEHPTIQVGGEPREIGFIGLLNGCLGAWPDGVGFICVRYGPEGELLQFELTDPPLEGKPRTQTVQATTRRSTEGEA